MRPQRRLRFRTQLFVTVTLILAVVVIASTTVTFVVTRSQAYRSVGDLARAQLGQYARLGVFAAIVGPESKSAVRRFFDEMEGQQAIVAVELRGSSGSSLGQWGNEPSALGVCGFRPGPDIVRSAEVTRRDGYWCAVGPILQAGRDRVGGGRQPDTVIGELRVVDSLADTRQAVRRLAAWNFGGGIAILGAGILVAWRGVRRLTDPLDDLAGVMRQLKEGTAKVRAQTDGPREVADMASVFNELQALTEASASKLESEVEARTRELRSASDTARAAVRYKNVFMATFTHEMRTPLHVIQAHAGDVLSELEFIHDASVSRRHTTVILKQADELLQRVNQILELARAESAAGDVQRQEIDLSSFASELRERSALMAREHQNTIDVRCDPLIVEGDRDRLWVILSNLVTNACKFTRSGWVDVQLRVRDENLELSVCDNGPGISDEVQNTLWQEFARVDRRDGNARGFGLGLAIVKRLTEVLGGKIDLTSRPGMGTSIRVTIPVGSKSIGMEDTDVIASGAEDRCG